MDYFLPAFDNALVDAGKAHLAGKWASENNDIELDIEVSSDTLVATRCIVNGTDALAALNGGKATDRAPIWSTGNDEIR